MAENDEARDDGLLGVSRANGRSSERGAITPLRLPDRGIAGRSPVAPVSWTSEPTALDLASDHG